MRPEWEREVRGLEKPRGVQTGLETRRQFHRVVCHVHNIDEAHGSARVPFHDELSYPEFDLVRRGLEEVCRDLLHLFFQVLHGKVHGRSADRRGAASKGADAGGDSRSIAMDGNDIVRFEAELVGCNLCERGFLPLAMWGRAGKDGDLAGALDAHATGFPTAARHCGGRSHGANLDIRRKTDAHVFALAAKLGLLPA